MHQSYHQYGFIFEIEAQLSMRRNRDWTMDGLHWNIADIVRNNG